MQKYLNDVVKQFKKLNDDEVIKIIRRYQYKKDIEDFMRVYNSLSKYVIGCINRYGLKECDDIYDIIMWDKLYNVMCKYDTDYTEIEQFMKYFNVTIDNLVTDIRRKRSREMKYNNEYRTVDIEEQYPINLIQIVKKHLTKKYRQILFSYFKFSSEVDLKKYQNNKGKVTHRSISRVVGMTEEGVRKSILLSLEKLRPIVKQQINKRKMLMMLLN